MKSILKNLIHVKKTKMFTCLFSLKKIYIYKFIQDKNYRKLNYWIYIFLFLSKLLSLYSLFKEKRKKRNTKKSINKASENTNEFEICPKESTINQI